MEVETEELFKKWLKIQILEHRLSLIFKILTISFFAVSIWITYKFVLPPLRKQAENLQDMLDTMSTVSETTQKQQNLFEDVESQLQNF